MRLRSLPMSMSDEEARIARNLLAIEETIVTSLRQRAEEAERAYDSLVRMTAEETPYWQAIARAAERIWGGAGLPFADLFDALDSARAAGLEWSMVPEEKT